MRNLIGFDTPSKAKAQEELSGQGDSQPQMDMGMPMNSEKLKQETLLRLQELGAIITSPQYNAYKQEHKTQILLDFTYYSKVADSL